MLGSAFGPDRLIETFGLVGLYAVVFAESGLLIGFFLPGDSLLFTAGAVAAGVLEGTVDVHFNIWAVVAGVFVAAVLGDQVGYLFGRRVGPALFGRPESRFFRREHVESAHHFFERHGPRAIVLARFVPVVRTFTPIVAGIGTMRYRTFVTFNVVGALIWGVGVTMLGYWFGGVPWVRRHLEVTVLAVVVISMLPIAVEFVRHRSRRGRLTAPPGKD